MDYKENLKKTYNKIAEDWNQDHQNDIWSVEAAKKFASLFKKGSKILDIGCGSGLKSRAIIDKGLKVVGIDISEKMIKLARKNAPEGIFQVMDMEGITFKGKFDGVFAQACLLHVPKKESSRNY